MMCFIKNKNILYADHKNYLLLFGLFSICFLLHFFIALNYGKINSDGTHYLSLGKNIIELRQYKSFGSLSPDIIQPPVFPILIAISYFFTNDAIISGYFISSLFSALSIIPLFLIGEKLFNRTASILATLLFIANPLLFSTTTSILSEPTFCFFFLWVVFFFFSFLRKPSSLAALTIGVMIGLAYSTRVEGLLLIITFIIFLIIERHNNFKWQNRAKYLFYGLIGFLVIYLPLSLFIYSHSGRWMACPKIQFIMTHKKMRQELKSDPVFRKSSNTLKYEKSLYKYSPNALDLKANRLFFGKDKQEGSKAGSVKDHRGYSASINKAIHFGFVQIRRYCQNLLQAFKFSQYNVFFPKLLLPMLILGLLAEPWSKERWQINLRLFIIIFVSSFFLFSHFESRFMLPIIPIGLLWCARGTVIFSQWLVNSFRSLNLIFSQNIANTLVVCILLLSMLPSWITIMQTYSKKMKVYKNEANLIESYVPKEAIVIARNPVSSYLADRKYKPLPYLNFDELLRYSEQFSKSALLFRKKDESLRPELSRQLNLLRNQIKTDTKFKIITKNDCSIVLLQ